MKLTAEEITKLENKYKKLSLTIKDNVLLFLIKDKEGFSTYGFDIEDSKVDRPNQKQQKIDYTGLTEVLNNFLDSADSLGGYTEDLSPDVEVENHEDQSTFYTLSPVGVQFLVQTGNFYRDGVPTIETTYGLKPKYKGKGIGSRIYNTVLKKFGAFYSDDTVSKSAMNLYLSGASRGHVELFINGEKLDKDEVFNLANKNTNYLSHAIQVIDTVGNSVSKLGDMDVYFKFNKKPDPERIKQVSPKTIRYINEARKKAGIKSAGPIKLSTLRDAAKRSPKETKKPTGKKDWWDFMSYTEQKNYLKAYPNSKKKINKSPGSKS